MLQAQPSRVSQLRRRNGPIAAGSARAPGRSTAKQPLPPPPPAPASTQSWPSASHGGLPPALCQSAADTSCASRRLRPGTARNPHEPGEPRRVSAAAATAVVVAVCMFACMSACCVCLCVCVRAEGALNVAGGVGGTWEMSSGRTDGSASLVQTIALRYRLRTSFRQMKSLSASARDTLDIVAMAAARRQRRARAARRHGVQKLENAAD